MSLKFKLTKNQGPLKLILPLSVIYIDTYILMYNKVEILINKIEQLHLQSTVV